MDKLSKAQATILTRMAEGEHITATGGGNPSAALGNKMTPIRFNTLFALLRARFIINEKPSPYSPVEGHYTITQTGRDALAQVKQGEG